jgi:hypothetical protein
MKSASEYSELKSINRKVRKEGAEIAKGFRGPGYSNICVSREGAGGEFEIRA